MRTTVQRRVLFKQNGKENLKEAELSFKLQKKKNPSSSHYSKDCINIPPSSKTQNHRIHLCPPTVNIQTYKKCRDKSANKNCPPHQYNVVLNVIQLFS